MSQVLDEPSLGFENGVGRGDERRKRRNSKELQGFDKFVKKKSHHSRGGGEVKGRLQQRRGRRRQSKVGGDVRSFAASRSAAAELGSGFGKFGRAKRFGLDLGAGIGWSVGVLFGGIIWTLRSSIIGRLRLEYYGEYE
ncbi:hypothetical protein Droror1_Dr00025813 [Drosera rotundifolia]